MVRPLVRIATAAALALPLLAGGPAKAHDDGWVLSGATLGGATVTGVFFTNAYDFLATWDFIETGASNLEFTSSAPGATVGFSSLTILTVTDGLGDSLSFTFAAPGLDGSTSPLLVISSSETYVTSGGPVTITGSTGEVDLPEPASIAVLGIALAGLAASRRRRAR